MANRIEWDVVWLYERGILWHISGGYRLGKGQEFDWHTMVISTQCHMLIPTNRQGWSWNDPAGYSQRGGPFCTECIINFVKEKPV